MVWSGDFHCFVRQHSDEVPKVAHPMPWFAGLVIERDRPPLSAHGYPQLQMSCKHHR